MSQNLQQELNSLYNEVRGHDRLLLALGERIAVLEKAPANLAGLPLMQSAADAVIGLDKALTALSADVGALHTRVEALESMDFEGMAVDAANAAAASPNAEPPTHESPGPSAPTFDAPAETVTDPQHVDDTQFTENRLSTV